MNVQSCCFALSSYSFFYFLVAAHLRACLHGGGGPKVGEVTRLGGVKQ